jgi:hypothetical protein
MSRHVGYAVLALALLAPGCKSIAGPENRSISGLVRYTDGRVAVGAMVQADGAVPTYSDALGRYTIAVTSRALTVTVSASEAPSGGPTVGSLTGRIQVVTLGKVTGRDIVLDFFQPI